MPLTGVPVLNKPRLAAQSVCDGLDSAIISWLVHFRSNFSNTLLKSCFPSVIFYLPYIVDAEEIQG